MPRCGSGPAVPGDFARRYVALLNYVQAKEKEEMDRLEAEREAQEAEARRDYLVGDSAPRRLIKPSGNRVWLPGDLDD